MEKGWGYLFLFVLGAGLFASCSDSEDYYSLDDVWISMGMVQQPDSTGESFFIITDNRDTLIPLASNVPYLETNNQQRVFVNYTILGDANTTGTKFWVKINNLQEVLLKNLLPLTPENSDSLGDDPIHVVDAWLSAGCFLNLDLAFPGGETVHWVNMVYTAFPLSGAESPVELELRHNERNDTLNFPLRAIVTFDLSALQQIGNDTVEFVVRYQNLDGVMKNFSGTFTDNGSPASAGSHLNM